MSDTAEAVSETEETETETETEDASNDGMFEDADGSMTVNLSNVQDDGWDVLPRGIYNVIVDDAEYKLSSNNNPMISLTLQVEDGEYEGRKLFTHIVFSPKAMGMAKRSIARLGLTQLLEGDFKPEDIADDFVGARARARVTIEKYEDEDTNKVKALLPAGGGEEFAES